MGSGVFVSIASGTAGAIILPSFTIIAGYSIYLAIGSSLLIDCIIGGIAGVVFLKKGNINLDKISALVIAGVIGAFIGSRFTSDAPEYSLNLIIGIFLIFLGLNFMINGINKNINYLYSKFKFKFFRQHKIFTFSFVGAIIGLFGGFIGAGSAGFVAIILVLIYQYDIHTGVGTALFSMFFIAGSGVLGHAINNQIAYDSVALAGIGAFLGALSGSIYVNKIDEEKLGKIIGFVVTILGLLFLIKVYYV
jgi:uncharacterized membrane protein YfcA